MKKLLLLFLSLFLCFFFGQKTWAQAQLHPNDSMLLRQILQATNLPGSEWNVSNNMNNDNNLVWFEPANSPTDTFFGVTTVVQNGYRRVVEINLNGVNFSAGLKLKGKIPAYMLDSSSAVKKLNLSHNELTGVDGFISGTINNTLEEIDVSENLFDTTQPMYFNYLIKDNIALRYFLANNVYDTSISFVNGINFISNIPSSLIVFDIGNNRINGTFEMNMLIPAQNSLMSIALNNNKFQDISNVNNFSPLTLQYLDISHNELNNFSILKNLLIQSKASIVSFSAKNALNTAGGQTHTVNFSNFLSSNLNELIFFDIAQNNIESTLPSYFFYKMPKIEILHLQANKFHGKLPKAKQGTNRYMGLDSLEELNINNNNLNGKINLFTLFGGQLINQQNNSFLKTKLMSFKFNKNNFHEIVDLRTIPTLANVASQLNNRFEYLEELHAKENRLDFNDLYQLRIFFNLVHYTISPLQGYYPQAAIDPGTGIPDPLSFAYSPQNNIGIGGIRRLKPGKQLSFGFDKGGMISNLDPGAPINNIPLSNHYFWYREDTSGTHGGSVANPLRESLGDIKVQHGIGAGITKYLSSIAQNNGYDFSNTPGQAHKLKISNLDPQLHADWIYYTEIQNDSFPNLTLRSASKKVEVGYCYDDFGAIIECQNIMVQFHPDSLAAYSTLAEQDSFKNAQREAIGATIVDSCLCGDIQLWNISDTVTTMLEGNGKGTRRYITTKSSSLLTLLSADANYSLLDSQNSPLNDDSLAIASNEGNSDSKTLVAIIDSGVDYEYSDLKPFISEGRSTANPCITDDIFGYNFLDENNNAQDDHGHGTAVAGIVAGLSQANVAPATNQNKIGILPIKYTNKEGSGTLFHAACAVRYAADYERLTSNGDTARVRVINASWGYYGEPCMLLENAITYAAEECDILFVTSAGNDGVNVQSADSLKHWPSNSIFDPNNSIDADNVLSVAALSANDMDRLASFSNYGDMHIDIAAIGYDTSVQAGTVNGFGDVNGTSFSSAQVSRAAALLYDQYPQASYAAIKYALIQSSETLQSADSSKIVAGRLNLQAAQALLAQITNPTVCNIDSIDIGTAVQVRNQANNNLTVYPNPFQDEIQITFEQPFKEKTQIQLYNINGQTIKQLELEAGQQLLTIPTVNLASGIYFIEIRNTQWFSSSKLIK